MAITDYDTLQSAVARLAAGSSDTNFAENIRDCIGLCEAELDRSLRVPEMIARTRATLDETWDALPTDLLKLISVSVIEGEGTDATERAIGQVSEDIAPAIARLYRSGPPKKFVLNATQIRVLPPASTAAPVTVRLLYYARVVRLSAAIPCYATLLAYPDIYLFGTAAYLAEYVEDQERFGRFDARFRSGIQAANRAAVTRDATLAA